jgi:hypothetical protein
MLLKGIEIDPTKGTKRFRKQREYIQIWRWNRCTDQKSSIWSGAMLWTIQLSLQWNIHNSNPRSITHIDKQHLTLHSAHHGQCSNHEITSSWSALSYAHIRTVPKDISSRFAICVMWVTQCWCHEGVVNVISGAGRVTLPAIMKTGKVDVFAFIGTSKAADSIQKAHPNPHRLRVCLGLEGKPNLC